MQITCISDLHGHYPKLEGGDLLIVAGDLTATDSLEENARAISWMEMQDYKKIVFIAGNHDNFLQEYGWDYSNRPEYLCDSGTEFEGIKIWGSPWSKTFPGMNPKCKAFTLDTEEELAEKWALIPVDTDILITHSPAYGMLDEVERYPGGRIENTGSLSLLRKAGSLPNLKLHVFGHIHEGYQKIDLKQLRDRLGEELLYKFAGPPQCKCFPILVNASHVNKHYKPVNAPIRVEL